MQEIIVTGSPKEIAALALEMQERQKQVFRLFIDGKEFGEKVFSEITKATKAKKSETPG